ncbi:hypothetical protein [Rhodococcus sp. NPDC058481]|uniref:hypothetical protein n=1 Tax=unclassified Rhodococcus (in: high G+C Gram-positive bacteria) TaxID=192944 RepID=UPI003659F275
MTTEQLTARDYLAAMFSRDFVEGGFDVDAVEKIHGGVFDEWILAVARSGVLTNREVALVTESWRRDPRLLMDALLLDSDRVTRGRYESAWEALDRSAEERAEAVVEGVPILV